MIGEAPAAVNRALPAVFVGFLAEKNAKYEERSTKSEKSHAFSSYFALRTLSFVPRLGDAGKLG
jgi:hypothetical protein